jgi:excinuclease ABC subunit C
MVSGEDSDALNSFLSQYYEKATDIPKEVLIPHQIEEPELIEEVLSEMKGQKVKLMVPERGKKNHLLELSFANAQSFARQSQVKWQGAEKGNRQQAMEELQALLRLPDPPQRMECYDISHFGGTETVSSMVVFEKGFPKKEDYRHFKLHQQQSGAPNDFASMEETLTRRLKYLKPSVAAADLKLRKPKKKEIETLLKEIKAKKLPAKTFFIIEKAKKYAGFVQVFEAPGKKAQIEKIKAAPNIDLSYIIKKVVEKTKVARIYIATPNVQIPAYEELGCQQIQKIPDFILPANRLVKGETILVFDKTKHIEDKSFKKIPDLIVIDGGKGQLSSAQKALKKYGLKIPMISLAKKEEEIFAPNLPQSIRLEHSNPVLHLIQHIRDESHRFAVTYHQKLRLKAVTSSVLDSIYGIGPEIKMKLLRHFGSPENIKIASQDEIAKIIGPKAAAKVKEAIR